MTEELELSGILADMQFSEQHDITEADWAFVVGTPRNWQRPVISRTVQYVRQTVGANTPGTRAGGTIVTPCGSGKTFIALSIAKMLAGKTPEWKVLVICNDTVVEAQWQAHGLSHNVNIVTRTIDSNQQYDRCYMVILDEAHQVLTDNRILKLKEDMKRSSGTLQFVLGLTGSYFRRSNESDPTKTSTGGEGLSQLSNVGPQDFSIETLENILKRVEGCNVDPLLVVRVVQLQNLTPVPGLSPVNFYHHTVPKRRSDNKDDRLNQYSVALAVRLVNSAVAQGLHVVVYCGHQQDDKGLNVLAVYAAALGCQPASGVLDGLRFVASAATSADDRNKMVARLRTLHQALDGLGTCLLLSNVMDTGMDLPALSVMVQVELHHVCPVEYIQRLGRIQRFLPGKTAQCHVICGSVIQEQKMKKSTDYIKKPMVGFEFNPTCCAWTHKSMEAEHMISENFITSFETLRNNSRNECEPSNKLKRTRNNR